MDSPQSVVSPFKNSSMFAASGKQTADLLHNRVPDQKKDMAVYNAKNPIGVIEVFVHQARDIHNICIYHKQDVYAKLCLTSDPENAVSTKTINGGGQNPVFNDNVRLNVHTVDASLKCEVWMLSRVRNYLEDQLLGFALVPLSEVLMGNGKLEKEFSLSSTDLFHSPAGFIRLSLAYNGAFPDVLAIPSMPASTIATAAQNEEEALESFSSELDRIEFPDPKTMNENHLMVSECFGIPSADFISQSSDGFSSDTEIQLNSEAGVKFRESFSGGTASPIQITKLDSPPSCGSAFEVNSHSSETPSASKFSKDDDCSLPKEILKEKSPDVSDTKSNTSANESIGSFVKPVINVNLEPEEKIVQQDIVDMYMKSMQQFTESLAKMKLPLDVDNTTPACSGDSGSDHKVQSSKTSGNRVFYGSRAFF